jgi:DNA repair exonuclease SbcCD ATPase subunit
VRWTELEVKNFLSFEHFKMSLDKRGVVLIEGENLTSGKFKSNGAGKSSLLEPLVYALYDTTSKGIKADEVINNKVGKNTAVILTGYKGEDQYRIERYRKHTKNKNKVRLFLNDKEITEKSAADTNKAIEKIVGIDYNTFVNSIMFSQGSGAGRFAIATDKEKKEILENLVNLEIYAKSQDIAKNRVKQKDSEIEAKKREGERLQWELAQVDTLEEQDKANYENTKSLIKQEQDSLGATIEEMSKYTQHNFGPIEQLREEIEQLKGQRDNATGIDISAEEAEVKRLEGVIREITNQQQRFNDKKADMVSQYKKLQTSTNCPVCGSELDPTHREQEMATIKENLRQVLITLQTFEKQLTPAQAEYDQAVAKYQEVKNTYDNINNAYRQLVNSIQTKEQQVHNYERTLQTYRDKIENIKSTLEKLRNIPEPRSRDSERETIRNKIKAHKEQLLALEREKKQLEDVVKIYSNSGVKSHVLDLITPFLNERANKYLAILSGPDMEVKFSTQTQNKDGSFSDKFDLQLTNITGGGNYKANSEGEKKRADLSISLAIQDLVMARGDSATNFVVYDEVFDALDSVGSESVVTLLRERLNTVGSIFVITHNETLKPLFEKVVTVVKNKQGISTIKEGAETT